MKQQGYKTNFQQKHIKPPEMKAIEKFKVKQASSGLNMDKWLRKLEKRRQKELNKANARFIKIQFGHE